MPVDEAMTARAVRGRRTARPPPECREARRAQRQPPPGAFRAAILPPTTSNPSAGPRLSCPCRQSFTASKEIT
ncbi:hypothetical protein GCM10011345_18230 [Gemmobacter megaterium]|nr:hypothetical protein GCM10011345_18230 [Gemmobacter megaterium]